ncbi:MAG: BspA family leucine-rich repeat surface protein, partial [Lachnospiraceae bacterium]|nr:BspA family leucine-rich repeat surface protein [Lachnospiraceae bacterium]
ITGLTAEGIDTSNVTTMESMFYGCKKLESLDLSNFDTIKVENMKHMFYSCTSLGALDVSSFDTEKVTDMSYIFYSCESLENLNINNFKTPLVTKMTSMFYNCKELTTLNLSNLDTSKITDMSSMFSGCNGLTSLNLSSFNTELVTNMNYMFRNCSSLEQINVSSFNTANVTTMSNMFFGCSSLTSLDLSSFDLSQVVYGNSQTPLSGFIGGLTSLTTLKTPKNISDTWNNTSAIQLPSKDGYFWFVEGVGEVTSMAVGQSQSQTIIRKERENITYVTMDLAVEETATEGRPIIKVIFTDLENPQDITGFNLTINNGSNLVTGDWKQNYNTATKTFTYQPQEALAPGSYTVKVSVVTDLPMLVKEKTKTFTVEEPEVINVTMDLTVEETETAGKPMIKVTFTGLENANDITSLALTLNNGANLITGNWQNNYNASTKTFTYQPQEALAPGNYTVKVTVVTNLPMQEKEKTASFTVVAPDVTSVSMELTVEETTTVGKPMIKVTFTGLENASDITSLSLTLNNGENLITGDWKEKYDTATKTFTWQPDQVLEPGDYTVKVSVETSLPMSVKEKTASFTVSGSQPPIGGETTLEFDASLSMDREGGLRIRAWKKSDAITKIEAQITQNFPEAESIVETPVAMNYVDNYYTRYAVLKEGISGISVKITAYNEAGETTEKVIPLTEPNIETEAVNDLWVRFLDGYGEDNKNYVYTGSAIKPKVQVYEATTLLTEKKDYTLSYKNNTNVYEGSDNGKLPQVIVNGKGNYKGKEIAVFTIVPKDIENEDAVETLQTVTIADMSAIAKNKEQKLVPVITYGKKKLTNKKNKDFEVTYPDTVEGAYQKPGSYTVKVEGKNNYRGIIEIDFTIGGKLMKNMKVSKIANQTYTGSEITIPDLTVSDGKTPLVRGQHYELEPVNNIEIGKATIIIKATEGQYDYVGSKTVTFNIVGTAISKATVDPDSLPKSVVYDGQEKEPEIKLTWKKDKNATAVPLVKGTDYEVDYDKNLDAGTATVIITGKGRFSGTMKKTFKILPFDAKTNEGSKLSVEKGVEITYAKGGAKPQPQVTFGDVLLKEGVDYTLSYSNNKAVTQSSTAKKPQVKVTFKKNFKGSLSEEFTILPQDISKVTILAQDKVYSTKKNGWKTTITLTDLDGKKLTAGTDYEKAFTYYTDEACTTAAQAETYETGTVLWVKVEGKNNYAGSSITGSYRIVKASVAKATVKVAPQYYTSEAITLNKNDLTVKIGGTTLEYGVDYIIVEDSYINNIKKGTAKVQIKGIGDNYGGVKTVSFSIKQKSFLFRLLPQLFQR